MAGCGDSIVKARGYAGCGGSEGTEASIECHGGENDDNVVMRTWRRSGGKNGGRGCENTNMEDVAGGATVNPVNALVRLL